MLLYLQLRWKMIMVWPRVEVVGVHVYFEVRAKKKGQGLFQGLWPEQMNDGTFAETGDLEETRAYV